MAGAVPGPPDLISDMVQPVDLVNSVQRPAVETMENGQQVVAQAAAVMPVDMLGDLPSPQSQVEWAMGYWLLLLGCEFD